MSHIARLQIGAETLVPVDPAIVPREFSRARLHAHGVARHDLGDQGMGRRNELAGADRVLLNTPFRRKLSAGNVVDDNEGVQPDGDALAVFNQKVNGLLPVFWKSSEVAVQLLV